MKAPERMALMLAIALSAPTAHATAPAQRDADACVARGDFACAETILRRLYRDPDYAADRWNLMGNIAFYQEKQGRLDAALDWLIEHLPDAPNDHEHERAHAFIVRLIDARIADADAAITRLDAITAEVILRGLLDRPLDEKRRWEVRIRLGNSLILQRRCREARRMLRAQRVEATDDDERARLDALIGRCLGTLTADCGSGAESVALEVRGRLGEPRSCPATFADIEPGPVVLVATFRGHEAPVRVATEVVASERITALLTPPPLRPPSSGPIITAIAGGALLVAGLGFYGANQSTLDELVDNEREALRDEVDVWRALSGTCYGMSAVAFVSAGVWWMIDRSGRAAAPGLDGTIQPAVYVTPLGIGGVF